MTPTSTPNPAATPVGPTTPESLTAELLLPFLVSAAVAVAIVLVALLLARFTRRATLRALGRTRADESTALLVGRAAFIGVLTVGVLTALGALGIPWTTVVALTSVLGLAASLALQDVLKNFVAGVYLLVERPFRLGEEIKVRDFVGRVETVELRTTVLRTAEGEAVLVPNAILFAEVILNRGLQPRRPGAEAAEAGPPL